MTAAARLLPDGDIVLIKPGSMGDVIHALPVAHALKAMQPTSRVTWIVDSRWAPLLHRVPCVDRVVEFPRNHFRGPVGWVRALRWYAGLSALRPKLVIDIQGLLRSGLMTKCLRPTHSIGLSDAREGAVHMVGEVADVSGVRHAVDRYLQVLPLCGVEIPPCPEFPLPPGDSLVDAPVGAIVIHPFARGEGKSLTPDAISGLCQALAPTPVIICGMGVCPENTGPHVTDLTNQTTLLQLLGIIRSASAVISVDSGPMHLAAALGRPLLAIHTWSDPRKVGPYSSSSWIWQGGEIRQQSLATDAGILPETAITSSAIEQIAGWALTK